MLIISKLLFERWNSDCIRYCHWKSNEHLMEGLNGETDLDVYVFPEDKEKAEKKLRALDLIKLKQQPYCTYPSVDEWLGFDESTGKFIHVHLHYQIITGTKFNKEYVFPIDEVLIDTRIMSEETGVFTASYELELLILYSRIALKANDKKHIQPSKDYSKEISYLKKKYSKEKLKALLETLLGDCAPEVYACIEKDELTQNEWFNLFRYVSGWLRPYRSKSAIQVFFRYHYFRIRNCLVRYLNSKCDCLFLTKKAMPGRGLSICFIGADGSGKSTVNKEISEWLSWKLENHTFYFGSGDGYKRHITFLSRVIAKLHHPAAYYLRIAQYYVRQLKRVAGYIDQGGIALFDRFPQNQFRGIYDGPKISTLFSSDKPRQIVERLRKKEESLINECQNFQPDLVFKLIVPVEESIRRKHDNEELIRRKVEITDRLEFVNSEVHRIDATQDFAKEILTIKRIIWNRMLAK